MTLDIHRPYPGVALLVTDGGSVLLGAPADAFKATKKFCNDHELPFPRCLVAPQALLVEASPQFNPEFFLYDFLFVYGAAFKPELQGERLQLVLDSEQVNSALEALRITLTGPTRDEMTGYRDAHGNPVLDQHTVARLANVGEHMAIKKGDVPRAITDMVDAITFDRHGRVELLDGAVKLQRESPQSFLVRAGGSEAHVDLQIQPPVIPFATLPVPEVPNSPLTFGIKPLGTRNGFDLSGPTTGFLLWVNGRGVVYDGPVGTRYLLESQGISPEDIDVVVLSHCHEDHMGAFVELFLAGYRPRVLTAEPIYRSALVKLSSYFGRPPEEVATYIDYHRIVPGEPLEELGAKFNFFYTVHSIPTIGMNVSMPSSAGEHIIQISGDTMHNEGLDKMHQEGVITDETLAEMRHLIPDHVVERGHYFADVGEAIIHGHPSDWAQNPNDVVYYHCPDNEHTRSFGKRLAVPGAIDALVEPKKIHPATPARLLSALRFLDLKEPGWLATILHQGQSRTAATGDVLTSPNHDGSSHFTVIVSGTASVHKDGETEALATLRPGEFFGVIELVDDDGHSTATITAETPMELFEIDAKVFYDYVERRGMQELIHHIWAQRPGVESAKIFRRLDLAVRNRIARAAADARFPKGSVIIEEGSLGDDFYLLVDGEVDISAGGGHITTLKGGDPDNFFGEISALQPNRKRNATITALTDVYTLRIRGQQLRDLFEDHMGVRYALMVAIEQRGG